MGSLGGKKKSGTKAAAGRSEFADDGARRMPSFLDPVFREGARDKRLNMVAKSGRSSTNLSASAGTRPYVNTFLGGVQ